MRLPFRFSLRTLIVAITLVCIVAGFHAYVLRSRANQQRAIDVLAKAGAEADAFEWGNGDLGYIYHHRFRTTSLISLDLYDDDGWFTNYKRFLTERVVDADLEGIAIGMAEFQALKELPHLRILGINKCFVADEVHHHGKLGCKLRSLSIHDTSMVNVHADFLNIPSLEFLTVSKAEIDDSTIASLANLPLLRQLDLAGNPAITDRGVAELARLDRLERLVLYDTQVTADGIRQLAGNPHLKFVGLLRTGVSLDDLPALEKEFPNTEFLIDFSQESFLAPGVPW